MHTKSEQKGIGDWFCAIVKNVFTICFGRVWIIMRYFLFEKQAFNRLLKVIGIQMLVWSVMNVDQWTSPIKHLNIHGTLSLLVVPFLDL